MCSGSGTGSYLRRIDFCPKVEGRPRASGRGRPVEVRTRARQNLRTTTLQGYLAHKKHPPSLGLPYGPRHSPTVGSYEGVVSYERGTPVHK